MSEKGTKMTRQTYVEIYNLIDDTMRAAGEKVEAQCNRLVKTDAAPGTILAEEAIMSIKKNQKIYNQMKDLLRRFEEEVEALEIAAGTE